MMSSNKNKKKNKYTKSEKILIAILAIIIIYYWYQKNWSKNHDFVIEDCTNYECYNSIIEIHDYVNPSVDICVDFHEFACGNFLKNIAYKKQISSRILEEQKELENELNSLILQPIFEQDSKPIRIQKLFFQACLDVDKIDANSDERIFNIIDKIGGFPLLKGLNWQEKQFDWMQVMVKCRELGLPFQWFLEFNLHVFNNINYLKVSYPSIDELSIVTRKKLLESFMKKKIKLDELFDFEKKLTALLRKQNDYVSLSTVEELQTLHPLFNWIDFLNNVTSYEISAQMLIASNVKNYIVELYQLLKGTSKRTQANYVIWKIVEFFAPFMSQQLRQHFNSSRSDFCLNQTKKHFQYFSEIEYIKKYSAEEVTSSANELKDAIKEEFLNRMRKSTWSNSTAAEIYFRKFNKTKIDIGLKIYDYKFLEKNYLHLGNLNEEKNVFDILTQRTKNFYSSLFSQISERGIMPEEKNLIEHTKAIEIFYSQELNKIVVPPSILHGFFYNYKRPNFLNFASLGTLIARKFIENVELLTGEDLNVTNSAFEASNKCFEKNLQEVDKITENNQIIEKIFIDIIARDVAYVAYQNWVLEFGEEKKLPILDYTPNQLFWIKSSIVNCLKTDEAKVAKFRNLLSLRHSRFFSADFRCPENSSMNPLEKC